VLHKKPGDEFEAGVLGGKRGKGTITGVGKDGLSVRLALTEPPPERLPLTVAVGFPRQIQLRRILRDLSSMGVRRIILTGTDLGDPNYRRTSLLTDGGAEAALIEGAAQSRDTILPKIELCDSLDDFLKDFSKNKQIYTIAADNTEGALEPAPFFAAHGRKPAAVIAVGSERGWSSRERALFAAAGWEKLSLGSRALRTEAACTAAVELVSAFGLEV
jgi:RsmE family RNA methyltransferase